MECPPWRPECIPAAANVCYTFVERAHMHVAFIQQEDMSGLPDGGCHNQRGNIVDMKFLLSHRKFLVKIHALFIVASGLSKIEWNKSFLLGENQFLWDRNLFLVKIIHQIQSL